MKIITRQLLADTVPARFKLQYEQYRGSINYRSIDHGEIIDQLAQLVNPINPDEVDKIIGNKSWTSVPICDECGADGQIAVIQVGQEPDYESNTAHLCRVCLTAAALMLGKVV